MQPSLNASVSTDTAVKRHRLRPTRRRPFILLTVRGRNLPLPFKIDIGEAIAKFRRLPVTIDGISIKLPFVELKVKTDDLEQRVAREIAIRLSDRRILNAYECCDDCIDNALRSLHEIREIAVNAQVQLSHNIDGPLYVLLDAIRQPIREFLTFQERLDLPPGSRLRNRVPSNMCYPADHRDYYFAALEMLRTHIHRVLLQIAKIANIRIPSISESMRYSDAWDLQMYLQPPK